MVAEQVDLFPKQRVVTADSMQWPLEDLIAPDMSEYPDKGFIESVNRLGVLQPLLIEQTDEGYEIVEGRRRYWAARESGIKHVPVRVKQDDTNSHMLALTGNYARSNNPMDEYHHLRALVDSGHSIEAICKTTRINKRRAEKLLATGDRLSEDLKLAVQDDGIPFSAAEVLSTLPPERQAEAHDEYMKTGELSKKRALEFKTAVSQQNAAPEIPVSLFDLPEDPKMATDRVFSALSALEEALEVAITAGVPDAFGNALIDIQAMRAALEGASDA